MLHALILSLLALVLAFHALDLGGPALLLLWPALGFLVLGAGYAGLGPSVFGKRSDGRLSWWALILLLPCLLLIWGLWHLRRRLSREPARHEVADGLWVGRRPLPGELPPGTTLVVDLTAEFPAACRSGPGCDYLCLPVLDAGAPAGQKLRDLCLELARRPGVIYVHCAQGHGRSGMVVAGVLLGRGLAASASEAVALVRKVRPGVRLSRAQRRVLERLFAPPESR